MTVDPDQEGDREEISLYIYHSALQLLYSSFFIPEVNV